MVCYKHAMTHAKWVALVFRFKLIEPNFSKVVFLFFSLPWPWKRPWTYCLGLPSNCITLPFSLHVVSLSWLRPLQDSLLRNHGFFGLGYIFLSHKRAVVKTKCFDTQISHIRTNNVSTRFVCIFFVSVNVHFFIFKHWIYSCVFNIICWFLKKCILNL